MSRSSIENCLKFKIIFIYTFITSNFEEITIDDIKVNIGAEIIIELTEILWGIKTTDCFMLFS